MFVVVLRAQLGEQVKLHAQNEISTPEFEK